jgi:ABC-2 type transporter
MGWREFAVHNSPRVLGYAVLPRAALQMIFFALLGTLVGGPVQRDFNVVGVLGYALTALTVVGISDVPMADKLADVFWRIRTGTTSPVLVLVVRTWPYPVVGLGCVVAVSAVTPVAGAGRLGVHLLPLLPCYALMALSSAGLGLAAASAALGRRADVLIGNVAAYLLLLTSGAMLPPGRIGWVDHVGAVLPLRHGLAAVRAGLAGRAYGADLAAEAAVGAAWFVLAMAALAVLIRRARRAGHDHFS